MASPDLLSTLHDRITDLRVEVARLQEGLRNAIAWEASHQARMESHAQATTTRFAASESRLSAHDVRLTELGSQLTTTMARALVTETALRDMEKQLRPGRTLEGASWLPLAKIGLALFIALLAAAGIKVPPNLFSGASSPAVCVSSLFPT